MEQNRWKVPCQECRSSAPWHSTAGDLSQNKKNWIHTRGSFFIVWMEGPSSEAQRFSAWCFTAQHLSLRLLRRSRAMECAPSYVAANQAACGAEERGGQRRKTYPQTSIPKPRKYWISGVFSCPLVTCRARVAAGLADSVSRNRAKVMSCTDFSCLFHAFSAPKPLFRTSDRIRKHELSAKNRLCSFLRLRFA